METIVALATPSGNSGVAVIRISGENSKDILKKLIQQDMEFEPRKMYLKNVHAGDLVDKCLVVYFKAPFSFTGEDVVEVQSHGGYFLCQKIIEQIISYGARLSTRGEFSKRAFINGKMSLDQAEGIIDLINAESEMQAKTGTNLIQGKLKDKISEYQNEITDVLADIEAKLDYPEYDYTETETNLIKSRLKNLIENLNELILDSKNGLIIKNGVKVAIVGAPNVGKSSLLNSLTKSNKAIVTNIAGTTRDVVEAEYEFNGIIFRLYDTAGIHESLDKVEQIGISRAYETLDACDLVLKISSPDSICQIETKKPFINVFNKTDLMKTNKNFDICVSAETKENIEELKQLIFDKTVKSNIESNKFYLTNTRHIECIKLAINSLETALEIFSSTTFDIISLEIKKAWNYLGEVSGVVSNEEILDRVFSKFCLGK